MNFTRFNTRNPTDAIKLFRMADTFGKCGLLRIVDQCDALNHFRVTDYANDSNTIGGANQLAREPHWTNTAYETESQSGEFPKTLDGGLLSSFWHLRQQAMLLSGNSGFTLFQSSLYWTTLSRSEYHRYSLRLL